ncbi:MAG: host attachment protein [Alphaproteobacteria bacterium]|nr:host attachment protein [Alphaproteobacteria bacterium]
MNKDQKDIVAIHQSPTIWVLVADGKQAQIYTLTVQERHIPHKGGVKNSEELLEQNIIPIENMKWHADSPAMYDIGRNATGMVHESVGSARHMGEPRIDVRKEVKQNFAVTLTTHLNQEILQQKFDQLIIIAPPEMLGELRKGFSDLVQKNIIAELPKGFTKLDHKTLFEHLKTFLGNQMSKMTNTK